MTNPEKNLLRDASTAPVQTGNSIVTTDASGTPKSSPFTLSGGVDAIVVPVDCFELIVGPSGSLKVSEDSTMTHYDVVAANTKESIPCAKAGTIYVQGTGTLNFRFTTL